jgi:hypothetical protein
MAPEISKVSGPNSGLQPTLADRVKARVAEAERSLELGSTETNGAPRKRGRPPRAKKTSTLGLSQASKRESESLLKVYREMRELYRGYRRRAGTPAVPELRSAVTAFKRGQSLTSLVVIASFLDDRKLLAW